MAKNTKFVLESHGGPLKEVTEDMPTVPQSGFILKIQYAGLCYSDVHNWKRRNPLSMPGDVLGHEISGTVHELGSNVPADSDVKIGDNVMIFVWKGCRQCGWCTSGTQLCEALWQHSYGVALPGGFQQYMAVQETDLAYKVPAEVPMDLAALMGCSALTAYNAVRTVEQSVQRGITVRGYGTLLLFGAGGLGMWAIQFAKALFGDKVHIYVADIKEDTFAHAVQRGAKAGILMTRDATKEETIKAIKGVITDGVDGAVDFVNRPNTMETLFYCLNNGGSQACVGMQGGNLPDVPIVMLALSAKSIRGVRVGSFQMLREIFKLVQDHKLEGPPITHIPFDCAALSDGILKLSEGKVSGRLIMKTDSS